MPEFFYFIDFSFLIVFQVIFDSVEFMVYITYTLCNILFDIIHYIQCFNDIKYGFYHLINFFIYIFGFSNTDLRCQ